MYSLSLSELCLYVQVLGACPWATVEIGGFPLLADTPPSTSSIKESKNFKFFIACEATCSFWYVMTSRTQI
jgi:hypothetical protein